MQEGEKPDNCRCRYCHQLDKHHNWGGRGTKLIKLEEDLNWIYILLPQTKL